MKKRIIALTAGDYKGIGPEILLKSLREIKPRKGENFLIFGDEFFLKREAKKWGIEFNAQKIKAPEALHTLKNDFYVYSPEGSKLKRHNAWALSKASLQYFISAAEACNQGLCTALVTAPSEKMAFAAAGGGSGGHTEILKRITRSGDVVMFFSAEKMRVGLATEHYALKDVSKKITAKKIVSKLKIMNHSLKNLFRIKLPKIGVAGLNPHASENGLYGKEEERIIAPAVAIARRSGIDARGPYAADSLFWRAKKGEFDAVLAMYHDQGLAPLKSLYFDKAVHVTLGLPFIRTSPCHGSAKDIAGKGIASAKSMLNAIEFARQHTSSASKS